MVPSGARAGILEGLVRPMVLYPETEAFSMLPAAEGGPITEEARGLRAIDAVGVFDLGGGAPRTVPLRLAGGAVLADLVLAEGGGLHGVLDRGGAAFEDGAETASNSSRYRSP